MPTSAQSTPAETTRFTLPSRAELKQTLKVTDVTTRERTIKFPFKPGDVVSLHNHGSDALPTLTTVEAIGLVDTKVGSDGKVKWDKFSVSIKGTAMAHAVYRIFKATAAERKELASRCAVHGKFQLKLAA